MPPHPKALPPEKQTAAYKEECYVLYLDWRKQGAGMMKACDEARLKPAQVRYRRQMDPEFAQAEADAIARYGESLEEVIKDHAFGELRYIEVPDEDGGTKKIVKPTDPNAAEKLLKVHQPELWNPARKIEVDHTHKVDIKELFGDFDRLRAELERRRELTTGAIDAESWEETP